jgi:hypothetical protein
MNQEAFIQKSTRRVSQRDRILARLNETPGVWVPMPELVECSGAYAVHSRISDLRKDGHTIDQHSRIKDGIVHSSYRLELGIPDTAG